MACWCGFEWFATGGLMWYSFAGLLGFWVLLGLGGFV